MRFQKETDKQSIGSAADMYPGQRAIVTALEQKGVEIIGRLRDLGITEGSALECVGISPLGDPAAYRIRGAVIALRKRDAAFVSVIGEGD